MARSTRCDPSDPDQEYIYFMALVILIKNIYTLWGRNRPSACYILSEESSLPFDSTSNRYKNL